MKALLAGLLAAKVALVAGKDGTTLFAQGSGDVRPIASLTKLMAALVLLQDCKLDPFELHEITRATRTKTTRLVTGWSYSLGDLLHLALMRSDNRALPSLAEACHVTTDALAAKMTAKAQELGMKTASFVDPVGLQEGDRASAEDVLVMLRAALAVPEIADALAAQSFPVKGLDPKGAVHPVVIDNTDRVLPDAGDGVKVHGGKTGYTSAAGYCFAAEADVPGAGEVGIVLLGGPTKESRFEDFRRIVRLLKERRTPEPASAPPVRASAP